MSAHPAPDELFRLSAYRSVWPMGAEKVELLWGHPVFYGALDAADAQAAERAFPGRVAAIAAWNGDRGNLVLHSSLCGPGTCAQWPDRSDP